MVFRVDLPYQEFALFGQGNTRLPISAAKGWRNFGTAVSSAINCGVMHVTNE